MRILLAIAMTLLATIQVRGGVANLDEARKLCDEIMQSIGTGDYKTAFDTAALHWPMSKEEVDAMRAQTGEQLGMASRRFGDLIGTEFVTTEEAGRSLVRYVYLQKFQKHATRWMIVFYRPRDAWLINVMVWDDQLHSLFDGAGGKGR